MKTPSKISWNEEITKRFAEMLEPEEVIWNQAHPDHKKTFSVMEKLSIIGIKLSEEFPDYDCSLMSVLEKKSSSIQIFLDSLVDVLEGYDSDEDYFFKTEVLKTMQIIKINRRNTQTAETSETTLDIFNTI
ncbi:unnamed protein product [Gordionus sp. m RMFG-2023]